jgi:excinuclease UvrABC nuclease subunit
LFAREPARIALDQISEVPDQPAVFLVWAREGKPYLGRTSLLRRRLKRLVGERTNPSRLLNLRTLAERIDFWLTASQLESSLIFFYLARENFPEDYRKITRLRLPAFVRLTLSNDFPRTMITTHLGGRSLYYGPFRTRASAEAFESSFLDLFQIRRCQEDLQPHPAHPGCIYGEMNLCIRPCQQAVTLEEYASEVDRVVTFLRSDGASLLANAAGARERASSELDFEEAARQHKWHERIEKAIAARDDLAREVSQFSGVAITRSLEPQAVELWFFPWRAPVRFPLTAPVSLDQRLKEVVALLVPAPAPREEDLALLARWYYSSWRDGEWLFFEGQDKIPYRRLVNAVARVATRGTGLSL